MVFLLYFNSHTPVKIKSYPTLKLWTIRIRSELLKAKIFSLLAKKFFRTKRRQRNFALNIFTLSLLNKQKNCFKNLKSACICSIGIFPKKKIMSAKNPRQMIPRLVFRTRSWLLTFCRGYPPMMITNTCRYRSPLYSYRLPASKHIVK